MPFPPSPLANLQGRDALANLIAVPFIQGTIKFAAEVSRRLALKQSAALPLAQVRSLRPFDFSRSKSCRPSCLQ